MNRLSFYFTVVCLCAFATHANTQELSPKEQAAKGQATENHLVHTSLAPELEKFRPFINRTYRGEYKDEKSGKVAIDIAQWQRALNGRAIRVLHSIDEGKYGGETLFFFDKNQSSVRFYYFTTEGFYTEGSVSFDGNKMISTEIVNGEASGITSVISVAELSSSGVMTINSTYLKGDIEVNTSRAVYAPIPHQNPIFK
ncbi:hypothetical protein R50072_25030 [Simiduia litorea]|uniref:hypothetical protein n=1 Tax=Simiduia litorea TaxID=1435348 RepID=UPI0036F2BAC2